MEGVDEYRLPNIASQDDRAIRDSCGVACLLDLSNALGGPQHRVACYGDAKLPYPTIAYQSRPTALVRNSENGAAALHESM